MTERISAEIGVSGVRAIQVRVTGNRIAVTRAASADQPTLGQVYEGKGGADFDRFLKDSGFPNLPIVVSMPSVHAYLQYLHLPFEDEQKVRETAPFELEEYLQTVPVDETQVDLHLLNSSGDGTGLLAGAVEKENLNAIIRSLSSETRPITSIRFSLVSCYQYLLVTGATSDHEDFWIVSSDGTVVSLMLVTDGQPVVIRNFHLAPQSFPNEAKEAERNRQHTSSDWIRKLEEELQRTLVSNGVTREVNRIYFMGTAPANVSTGQLMEQMNGLIIPGDVSSGTSRSNGDHQSDGPGETATPGNQGVRGTGEKRDENDQPESGSAGDPSPALSTGQNEHLSEPELHWTVSEPMAPYCACIGAASTHQRSGSEGLEFRKGEFAEQTFMESIRSDVAVFLTACLLGTLTYLFVINKHLSHRKQVLRSYRAQQKKLFREQFPDQTVPAGTSIPNQLKERLEGKQKHNSEELPLKRSALQSWISLYSSLTGRGDIQITKLIIRLQQQGGGKLIVEGDSNTRERAVKLKNQIMSNADFGRPENARYPIRNNRVQFSMAFPISTD